MTDWDEHARFVPLTTIIRTPDGFIARTGLGPLAFDDPMEIVRWQEPSLCRLEKRGGVVTGGAELTVEPSGSGSRVTWREDIGVRGIPAMMDGLVSAVATRLFSRVIDGLLAS